ncbi:hypothetical protein EDD17DRAFT_1503685 [Pisolithus thermaeus]|nr:hypothetical protein EDD17DRAFT_1503685 [Pisolithus thermaeus]
MPSSRPMFKWCKCEECLESDANGILMDAQVMPAHLKRVQVECSRCEESSLKDLTGHLFALTLMDDGPDPNATADKLWKSCGDYQKTGPSSNIIASTLTTLQMPDIVDSLNHLQLHDAQPVDKPWTVPQSSPDSLASIITGDRLPKKDHCRCVAKALEILSNIEARTQRCFCLLLDSSNKHIPSTVRQELDLLHHAMEGVKHGHHSIDSYKKGIVTGLDKLEAQLRLHEPLESSVDPVLFKIGKFYSC